MIYPGNKPRRMSLYCGLRIFPSLFFAVGYSSGPRSSAISELCAIGCVVDDSVFNTENSLPLVSRPPPGSCILLLGILFTPRRILEILGSPNSSSSTYSLSMYCWLSSCSSSSTSSSSAAQSLLLGLANRG